MIFQPEMTLMEGLQLTVIAMAIVFTLLLAISIILTGFKHIPQDAPKAAPKPTAPTPAPVAAAPAVNMADLEADEDMMVAALVASMEAAGEEKDSNYKVTRITRL